MKQDYRCIIKQQKMLRNINIWDCGWTRNIPGGRKMKEKKVLNLMRCISGMEWGAERESLLYRYMRSTLDYGCLIQNCS